MDDLIIRLHGMAEAKNLAARQTQWVLEAAAKIQKLEAALLDAIIDIRESVHGLANVSGTISPGLDARIAYYRRCIRGAAETSDAR